MEAVFSVSTSRTVTESGVSSTAHCNVNTNSILSSSAKYSHPASVGIVCQDHSSVSLSHLTPDESAEHHLMRFADDLSLCMKPSPDGSLVDDEDEDVRSLLAAAAAVAAAGVNTSHDSPVVCSSSGLNTPPDTRISRPTDIPCTTFQGTISDRGSTLHSVNDDALLVSRISVPRVAFTEPNDPLNILLPTSVSPSVNFLVTSGVSTPSNSPLIFHPQSPSLSCTSNNISANSNLSTMMLHNKLPCESQSIQNSCVNDPFTSLHQFPSTNTSVLETENYSTCQHEEEQLFSCSLSLLNETSVHSSVSHNLNTSKISHSCDPPEKSTISSNSSRYNNNNNNNNNNNKSSKISSILVPLKALETCNSYTPSNNNNNNDNNDNKEISETWSTNINIQTNNLNTIDNHISNLCKLESKENIDSVCSTTAENLKDLEQVISSHRTLSPADDTTTIITPTTTTSTNDNNNINSDSINNSNDNDYVIKSSPKEFHLSTRMDCDRICSNQLSPSTKDKDLNTKTSVLVPEPDFPELYTDMSNVVTSNLDPIRIIISDTQSNSVESKTTDSMTNFTLISSSDSIGAYNSCETTTITNHLADSNIFDNLISLSDATNFSSPTSFSKNSSHLETCHEINISQSIISPKNSPSITTVHPIPTNNSSSSSPLPNDDRNHTNENITITSPPTTVPTTANVITLSNISTTTAATIATTTATTTTNNNNNNNSVNVLPSVKIREIEPTLDRNENEINESSVLSNNCSSLISKESANLEPQDDEDEEEEEEEEIYNDAEYAAAAVAAVDDVVYALAGNRKPDPLLTPDPALEGTGTDRIYTLSLAPVHTEPINCSQFAFCNLSNLNSSNHDVGTSSPDKFSAPIITDSSTPVTTNFRSLNSATSSVNPQCAQFHHPLPSNENTTKDSDNEQNKTKSTSNFNESAWNKPDNKGDFLCPACHKIFPQKALLLKHRIMHEEPKHVCKACGRCFVREDKLKRHVMSIHTAEKPHICHICSKAFSRKDKLKDHIKHHDRAARNFECQQCQQPFVQKSDLNRHIRGVHQGEPGVGINMTIKRKAPGAAPSRPVKKKTKSNPYIGTNSEFSQEQYKVTTAVHKVNSNLTNDNDPHISHTPNDKLTGHVGKIENMESGLSVVDHLNFTSCSNDNGVNVVTSTDVTAASLSAVAAAASLAPLSTTLTPTAVAPTAHPVFAAGASGLMLPSMALTQAAAHHHFVQQQQQQQQHAAAAAAAAVMLPGSGIASMASVHPSAIALQQQQQQHFFAMAAMPTLAQSNGQQPQQQQPSNPQNTQSHVHIPFQPELKTIATPSGPMMVLTRIAAANQAGQAHQLANQAVFPQVVGFHPTAAHQQQLQQLQQQQAVMAQQQQQLLQHQQANYAAAAAAAAAAGTQLVAVSSQHVNTNPTVGINGVTNQAHQFQLQQQAAQQLQQQQQAAALAAQQQAAHSFLFPSAASGATVATATGAPAAFFCHPQDGMTAGLILASSTDPTSFAFAAAAQAQAAAAAAAAQQRQQNTITSPAQNVNALAAASGLQVVTGYTTAEAQQTVAQQHFQQQQQLLLQQQHQQRLAVAAAAASASSSIASNSNQGVLLPSNTVDASSASVLVTSTQDEHLTQVHQSAPLVMAQPDAGPAVTVNNYQLAAITNAAAALYQQHPGFMFAAANASNAQNVVTSSPATVAAMALQQQQQQQQQYHHHQQQQAGLMAAYQQQQAAHHHALQQQQQHAQVLQQQHHL